MPDHDRPAGPPWLDFARWHAEQRRLNPLPGRDVVPDELASRPQWLLWRFEPGETPEKKPRKMPYYASGRRRHDVQGSEADRQQLVTFEVALVKCASDGRMDGVGFAFLPGDGLIGIDLDGMIDPATGEVSQRCASIVAACASYTELSPSGKGVHIFCRGETETFKSNAIGVEVFCGRQYFTFTGRRWPGSEHNPVGEIGEETLARLRATVRAARAASSAALSSPGDSPPPDDAPAAVRQEIGGRQRSLAETVALVEEALACVPADEYESWITIGLACKAGLGSAGFWVWDAWSASSERYAGQEDTRKRWQGFKPSQVTLGSVFAAAEGAGWVPPWKRERKRQRRTVPKPARAEPGAEPAGEQPTAQAAGGDVPADDGASPPKVISSGLAPSNGATDWNHHLLRKRGEVAPCLANAHTVLSRMPAWVGVVAHDEFAERTVFRRRPPCLDDGPDTGEWTDYHDVMTAIWLQRVLGSEFQPMTVGRAVEAVARACRFHPVRDALRALPGWDGVRRLPEWLSDYLGVERSEYAALVGTYLLRGMVYRVLKPGIKFDYCPVLEGAQGLGKSSVCRILGWHWFADTDIDLSNKDSLLALPGHWVYEIPEMGSLMRAEERKQKSFLSRQEDEFRPPYGKRMIKVPRQTVFVGTTNEEEYLKDATGARRFWPVACGDDFQLDALLGAREQLYAEALHDCDAGERCWPTKEEQAKLFDPEQRKRGMQEPFEDLLETWVNEQTAPFSMATAATDGLNLSADKLTPAVVTRIGIALRKIGCTRKEDRLAQDSSQRRLYLSPSLAKLPHWNATAGTSATPDGPF